MLQNIHEKVHGWIAWFVIILIAITFALFGASYYIGSHRVSDIKATVGDTAITKRAFEDEYQRSKQGKVISGLADEQKLKSQTLRQMIANYSRVDAARNEGFIVSKSQAQQAMLTMPDFVENGVFSKDRFQQILSANLLTPEALLHKVQQGMLLNQQRFMISASDFALPSELKNFVALTEQTRNYHYLLLSQDLFKDRVSVTQNEIKNFFNTHRALFMTPEQVIVSYVSISLPDLVAKTNISVEKAEQFYLENKSNYVRPAQYKIKHIFVAEGHKDKLPKIKQSLEAKKSFEKVADMYSDDLVAKGNTLPWMGAGVMDIAVDRALIKLSKKQVSRAVKTSNGYEIVKLVDIKPKKQLPFSDVREQIISYLKNEKAQQVFTEMNDKLTDLSYQNPDSLDEVAKELGLEIKTLGPITRVGDAKGLGANKHLLQAAFSQEVLEQGENSAPIKVSDDTVLVLRVKSHLKPTQKKLSEVQADIKQMIAANKAQSRAKELGQKILGLLRKDQDIAPLLLAEKVKFKSEVGARRNDSKVNPLVNELAFSLTNPEAKKNSLGGAYLDKINTYAVISLSKVTPGNLSSLDLDAKRNILKQLEISFGLRDYQFYLKSVMKDIKVSIK